MSEIRAITKLEFDNNVTRHFNSAALGEPAKWESAEKKQDFKWDRAVDVVRQKFGKLIGQPSPTVCVFHNTTAGVQRILLRLSHLLGRSDATLLLTDMEYPGIVSAVDETWTGRVVMAQVAKLIWRQEADRVMQKLEQSILLSRPTVIYLSHVARATGYRIDEKIVDFIRDTTPRCVIIFDGAQACGNINIDGALLPRIDFYVTSGHKWLCGEQTLGLVHANEQWGLKDPAQSYSMTRVSTGTGSRNVILSLQESLSDFNGELTGESAKDRMKAVEKHNSDLSRYFCAEILRKRLGRPVGTISRRTDSWKWNGIATVVFDSQQLVHKLGSSKFQFTVLRDESWRDSLGAAPPGRRYLLDVDEPDVFQPANFRESYVPKMEGYPVRFCFHHYHTKKQVDQLINEVELIQKELTRKHRR